MSGATLIFGAQMIRRVCIHAEKDRIELKHHEGKGRLKGRDFAALSLTLSPLFLAAF